MKCPACGAEVPLSLISDEDFLSERGRRNARRRRTHGGAFGLKVWNAHQPGRGRACLCATCLIDRVRRMEATYAAAVARATQATGVRPAWAEERTAKIEKFKSVVRDALARKGIVIESFN